MPPLSSSPAAPWTPDSAQTVLVGGSVGNDDDDDGKSGNGISGSSCVEVRWFGTGRGGGKVGGPSQGSKGSGSGERGRGGHRCSTSSSSSSSWFLKLKTLCCCFGRSGDAGMEGRRGSKENGEGGVEVGR
mmetsp:Transcript_30491/g.51494  ORF Transcript_30491/g.51494 Transcript_30491/m.51494 type:complete len:130 (-) Transcript_30491:38-427(-)